LFLTYINDLQEHTQSEAQLFSDDYQLFRKITKNNRCRATPKRPNIASGLGTTAADGIPSTEMYSDPHLQKEATNKVFTI
jgi:hypothetical protein